MATRNNENDTDNSSNRGFASMDPERQREIASQGGKAAHESGNAHEFTSEEAREAGTRSHINDNNSGGRGVAAVMTMMIAVVALVVGVAAVMTTTMIVAAVQVAEAQVELHHVMNRDDSRLDN